MQLQLLPSDSALYPPSILAKINFGSAQATLNEALDITCGVEQIEANQLAEIWLGSGTALSGVSHVGAESAPHQALWSSDGNYLFASTIIDNAGQLGIQQAAFQGYNCLLKLVQDKGFKYIARAWNYLPRINAGNGDEENYKQFSIGRHMALTDYGYSPEQYPAASALGHFGNALSIYLIASKAETLNFPNPKQENAYQYPRIFGPVGPSFARATLVRAKCNTLFISGTSSITGSQSIHIGSTRKQTELSCQNIRYLLDSIATKLNLSEPIQPHSLKVYLRHREDYASTSEQLAKLIPETSNIIFTHAEICRKELLVEIEAICYIDSLKQ